MLSLVEQDNNMWMSGDLGARDSTVIKHWHESVVLGVRGFVDTAEQDGKRERESKKKNAIAGAEEKERITIGQSLCRRVKRSEVPCQTIRHDGVVEVLWRFRYAGQARSAVQPCATTIPANFGQ